MRRIIKSEKMADLIGHALAARTEMVRIASEFDALIRMASVPTPAIDRLNKYTDPAVQPVTDGSAQILMNWRSVLIGLCVLVGLILISILLL